MRIQTNVEVGHSQWTTSSICDNVIGLITKWRKNEHHRRRFFDRSRWCLRACTSSFATNKRTVLIKMSNSIKLRHPNQELIGRTHFHFSKMSEEDRNIIEYRPPFAIARQKKMQCCRHRFFLVVALIIHAVSWTKKLIGPSCINLKLHLWFHWKQIW